MYNTARYKHTARTGDDFATANKQNIHQNENEM